MSIEVNIMMTIIVNNENNKRTYAIDFYVNTVLKDLIVKETCTTWFTGNPTITFHRANSNEIYSFFTFHSEEIKDIEQFIDMFEKYNEYIHYIKW